MFFLDFEKNTKKRKKRSHSFTGHLITQPLIHNYRKSVPVIKSPISNILLRNADTRNYATENCV